jgi:TolB-like protein
METGIDPGRADAVREHLDRVLRAENFEASQRNRHFLRYVVEEALAGRANRIKAYSIATVALGRSEDFDPQIDPIVRIEAHRLRRALAYYYMTAGKDDQIRIDIPKGSYVPAFVSVDDADPAPGPVAEKLLEKTPATGPGGPPTILVTPFEAEFDQAAYPNLTRSFTRQIVAGMSRFADLIVLGSDTTFAFTSLSEPERDALEKQVDFIVAGGCGLSGGRFSVEVLLVEAGTKQVVWGETFERDLEPDGIMAVRDEIANTIVRTLAQSYGVIFSRKVREIEGRLPRELLSYQCVMSFYQYWRTYDRTMYQDVRACLERTVVRSPQYAEAYASLSQICSDGYRFNFVPPAEHATSIERALELARHAIALAPRSSRGHHALALAYWFSGDALSSLEAFNAALSLNPNASQVTADLGQRYALLGEWEKGVPLIEESYRRNPALPGTYRIGLALYHFAHERYAEALAEARKINTPHLVFGYIAEAMALAGLGRDKEAALCVAKIQEIDPGYLGRAGEDLIARHVSPELAMKIIRMLRAAGAQVGIVEKISRG